MIPPLEAGSRSTIEVIHGSVRRHPTSCSSQRTLRARVSSIPITVVGAACPSRSAAAATSTRCTVHHATPCSTATSLIARFRPVTACLILIRRRAVSRARAGSWVLVWRERPALTQRFGADEPALADPQPQRHRPVRQVPHARRGPVLHQRRQHPASRTPALPLDALDQDTAAPVRVSRHVQNPEPRHREQQRRTVGHSSWLSSAEGVGTTSMTRPRALNDHDTPLKCEEPTKQGVAVV